MAKFAPGSVAHPGTAQVPWPIRKHVTAVQRHGRLCKGKWEPQVWGPQKCQVPGTFPDQTAPKISFPQCELHVVTGILCYSREKSWDIHSLPTAWRSKLFRPSPCQAFPFLLTSLSILFYVKLFLRLIILKISVLGSQLWGCKAFLSIKPPLSEVLSPLNAKWLHPVSRYMFI